MTREQKRRAWSDFFWFVVFVLSGLFTTAVLATMVKVVILIWKY